MWKCSYRTKAPSTMKMTGFGSTVEQLATCILFLVTPREAEKHPHISKQDLWTTEAWPRAETRMRSYDSHIRFTREDPSHRA